MSEDPFAAERPTRPDALQHQANDLIKDWVHCPEPWRRLIAYLAKLAREFTR